MRGEVGNQEVESAFVGHSQGLDREGIARLAGDELAIFPLLEVGEDMVEGEDHTGAGGELLRGGWRVIALDDAAPAGRLEVCRRGNAALDQPVQAADRPTRAEEGHLARIDLWRELARRGLRLFAGGHGVEALLEGDRADDHWTPAAVGVRGPHRLGLAGDVLHQRELVEGVDLGIDGVDDAILGRTRRPEAVELAEVRVRAAGEEGIQALAPAIAPGPARPSADRSPARSRERRAPGRPVLRPAGKPGRLARFQHRPSGAAPAPTRSPTAWPR